MGGPEQEKQRASELSDLRTVVSTEQGRRFLWRLLAHCRVFGSVSITDYGGGQMGWENPEKARYNSGRQDVGHFLFAELEKADRTAYQKMHHEAWSRVLEEEVKKDNEKRIMAKEPEHE